MSEGKQIKGIWYYDDCEKYADRKCASVTISSETNTGTDALGDYSGSYSGDTYTSKEECLNYHKSRCEVSNKKYKEEEKKFSQDRTKSMLKLSGLVVGVPLAFFAYSKYKKYDTKKTTKVVVIGSVLVLSALWYNAFSGAWGGDTISQRLLRKLGLKEKEIKN